MDLHPELIGFVFAILGYSAREMVAHFLKRKEIKAQQEAVAILKEIRSEIRKQTPKG